MKQRRFVRLVLGMLSLLALALALAWYAQRSTAALSSLSRPPDAVATFEPRTQARATRPVIETPQVQPDLLPPMPATDVSDPDARHRAAAAIDRTMQIYRETMTYPLSSRPADGSNEHLTQWNRSITVGQPFAVDASRREVQVSATIDRIFAGPGQALSVFAATTYVADKSPALVDEISAELQWFDHKTEEWIGEQAVPLRRVEAGWTGSMVPSRVEGLRAVHRETRILVHARLGEFARELALNFSYAAEQPVVIYGIASDRVVDGSLELGLDVDLRRTGTVRLIATLVGGKPAERIAVFDDRYFATRPGRQVIPVRFHGKILHDSQIDGPYHLSAIHGYVYLRDSVLDQLYFTHTGTSGLTTVPHQAAGFSPNPYHSPEVAARMAHYEKIREALRTGQHLPEPPRTQQANQTETH
jgi:hypothetical protein